MRASSRLMSSLRVAVLHQGAPVPPVGGVVKPMKPGGYADSSADIAFALRSKGVEVFTPALKPEPTKDLDWSIPDTTSSIRSAVSDHGVQVFWANTVLHSKHALVQLSEYLKDQDVRIVGQNPLDTEKFDDKEWTNRWLAQQEGLKDCFPQSCLLTRAHLDRDLGNIGLPAVVKPVRGRGSHGVKVVRSVEELRAGLEGLLKDSDAVLCEEYLEGEETTITVMPPGRYSIGTKSRHWALPVVARFDQVNGVAPWNGAVPVTANSRALTQAEHDSDPEYGIAQRKCERVADLCRATAPMRIDCRRRTDGGEIILFDVNMKPNATGPGRPGRENQMSLVAMAAEAMRWDFQELCVDILNQARPLKELLRLGVLKETEK